MFLGHLPPVISRGNTLVDNDPRIGVISPTLDKGQVKEIISKVLLVVGMAGVDIKVKVI